MKRVMAMAACAAAMLASALPVQAQLFSFAWLEHHEARVGQPMTYTRFCGNANNEPCLGIAKVYGSEVFYDVKVNAEDYGLLHGSAFIYNSRPAGTPPYHDSQLFYSDVTAGFLVGYNDTWTIEGGAPGTLGTLTFGFDLTGYMQAGSDTSSVGLMRLTNVNTLQSEYVELHLPSVFGATTVELSTAFRFGEPVSFQLTLSGSAYIRNERGGYDTQQADINLGNTAVIRQVSVFDQSGSPVDATVTTLSGSSYLGALPVPELPTPALHALGLAALLGLLRRRTRQA